MILMKSRVYPALFALTFVCGTGYAADWPTYLHDDTRSGITNENLTLPLYETWRYQATHAPEPAWPPPPPNDYWHNYRNLRPTVTYDRAYHVNVVGDTAFFASSADSKVYALDTASGHERWSFFTEGPVRLAPTIADGKVYIGSDDGSLYCLRAENGEPVWRFKTYQTDRRLPGNESMISYWPVRGGIVVDNGTVYFGAGLFPNEETYLFALDARDGSLQWKESVSITGEGYMLASPDNLYVPTGRTQPVRFARSDGSRQGDYESAGGAYALLTGDVIVTGPGRGEKAITVDDVKTRETLASFNGLRMLVNGNIAYLQSETKLSAFDRKRYLELARQRLPLQKKSDDLTKQLKEARRGDANNSDNIRNELRDLKVQIGNISEEMTQCYLWTVDCDCPYSMILAGETLFAGGENKITAIDPKTGESTWSANVIGDVYGLTAANGKLYASTGKGVIHCFTSTKTEHPNIIKPVVDTQPYPKDNLTDWYAETAQNIIAKTNADQGYCLVFGSEEGRLAYELAKQTRMQILCVEEDIDKVNASRQAFDKAGIYGTRITVHHGSIDTIEYPPYFANLIVSEKTLLTGELPSTGLNVYRLLRPYGGCLYIGQSFQPDMSVISSTKFKRNVWLSGLLPFALEIPDTIPGWEFDNAWLFHRRGALNGVGEWTQLYCNASHTANSGDLIRGPVTLQWFGAPGPEQIIDRHHRPMSSLVKDGRVFVPADNRIIAVDAYNGTRLWEREVPDSRRIGALKDCGQMVLTDDLVYIASAGECWGIDVANGERKLTFQLPDLAEGPHDWGYLNYIGNRLVGSGQKKNASFYKQTFTDDPENASNILEGDFRPVIVSDYLFSFDRHTQANPWHYKNGSIMNSAMAIGDGRVFFAECRNPDIINNPDGRVRIDHFCKKDLFLVALGLETGKKVLERPISLPYEHIMYINYADNIILLTGTYNKDNYVRYRLYALNADSGGELWNADYLGMNVNGDEPFGVEGSHGEQWQHPVIIGDTVYSKPYAYDLHTGEKKNYVFYRGGHGCGGFTGSAFYMYGRGSNPRMYPLETESTSGIQLTQVTRPGCWLNIIPAGGLILLPESSSGCTCAYSVQTSLAFAPREYYSPPLVLTRERSFSDSIQIELADRNGIGAIHYTLDGSEPTPESPVYTGPIALNQTASIKAKTFWGRDKASPITEANFVRQ